MKLGPVSKFRCFPEAVFRVQASRRQRKLYLSWVLSATLPSKADWERAGAESGRKGWVIIVSVDFKLGYKGRMQYRGKVVLFSGCEQCLEGRLGHRERTQELGC